MERSVSVGLVVTSVPGELKPTDKLELRADKVVVGKPRLTRYERARVVGARALQLSMGAPILVLIEKDLSPILIAERELKARVLPLSVKRELPDGRYQVIPLQSLADSEYLKQK